jgi:hypothetical protein
MGRFEMKEAKRAEQGAARRRLVPRALGSSGGCPAQQPRPRSISSRSPRREVFCTNNPKRLPNYFPKVGNFSMQRGPGPFGEIHPEQSEDLRSIEDSLVLILELEVAHSLGKSRRISSCGECRASAAARAAWNRSGRPAIWRAVLRPAKSLAVRELENGHRGEPIIVAVTSLGRSVCSLGTRADTLM